MNNWSLSIVSLMLNVPAVASICWAGHLASLETHNWGWFMAAGLFMMVLSTGSVNLAVQNQNTKK